jgi:hypothetical protein
VALHKRWILIEYFTIKRAKYKNPIWWFSFDIDCLSHLPGCSYVWGRSAQPTTTARPDKRSDSEGWVKSQLWEESEKGREVIYQCMFYNNVPKFRNALHHWRHLVKSTIILLSCRCQLVLKFKFSIHLDDLNLFHPSLTYRSQKRKQPSSFYLVNEPCFTLLLCLTHKWFFFDFVPYGVFFGSC